MVVAGVTPVGKIRTAGKVAKSAKYILDEKAAKHIIARHSGRSNVKETTKFPKNWSDKKILNAIQKVANSNKSKVTPNTKKRPGIIKIGKVSRQTIKVVIINRRIWTGYPLKKK